VRSRPPSGRRPSAARRRPGGRACASEGARQRLRAVASRTTHRRA
jgi:hypothetical protein